MASTAVTPATADGDIPHRLPSAVRAQHYDVTLQPDLEARTFVGDVVVTLKLAKATKVLHLNSIELEIQSATVGDAAASKIELNEKDEVATFSFDNELPAGEIKMRVKYTGILNDQMRGFYASTYTTVGGKEETKPETTTASSSSSSSSFPSPPSLLVTQFEATDCRRALPCIDEPAQKATFIVTLITPTDMTAISNMPCKSSTPVGDDGKLTRHTFDITPIMSTYLLAFCVGKFDMIEGKTSSGVIVRCFATPGKGEQNRFALEVAVKLLPYYDEWFAEKYPLPLLQMVAVPDFSAGAMENWGLVTYREAAVLLDPANSSTSTKQYVAVCVAHEVSANGWWKWREVFVSVLVVDGRENRTRKSASRVQLPRMPWH
jgi:puromycin-sensitive aminopeptidase